MVKYKREIRNCKFHQSLCEQSRFREVVEGNLQQSLVTNGSWKTFFGAGSCYPLIPQDIPTFKNFWFLVSVLVFGCAGTLISSSFLKAAQHEDTSYFWPCGEFYATNPTWATKKTFLLSNTLVVPYGSSYWLIIISLYPGSILPYITQPTRVMITTPLCSQKPSLGMFSLLRLTKTQLILE